MAHRVENRNEQFARGEQAILDATYYCAKTFMTSMVSYAIIRILPKAFFQDEEHRAFVSSVSLLTCKMASISVNVGLHMYAGFCLVTRCCLRNRVTNLYPRNGH